MKTQETDWRELCARVAEEQDPEHLSEMVEQLIQALDAVKQELEQSRPQFRPKVYEA